MSTAVILLSGGIDSSTLLHYAVKRLGIDDIRALSFQYGQKHSRETEMALIQAERAGVTEHRVLDMSFFSELIAGASTLVDADLPVPDLDQIPAGERDQPSTYVPNRNMIMLSVAAAFAEAVGATDIYYGAQTQDSYGYWDCTPEFILHMNAVLNLNRSTPVTIHAPFVEMSKADVIKIGLELGVNYTHTWTCYRGGPKPCGTCPSCIERNNAFKEIDESTTS